MSCDYMQLPLFLLSPALTYPVCGIHRALNVATLRWNYRHTNVPDLNVILVTYTRGKNIVLMVDESSHSELLHVICKLKRVRVWTYSYLSDYQTCERREYWPTHVTLHMWEPWILDGSYHTSHVGALNTEHRLTYTTLHIWEQWILVDT